MTQPEPIALEDITLDQAKLELLHARPELAKLRYRNKDLGKANGIAGRTIFELRNQVDALRALPGAGLLGDYRRLLQSLRAEQAENRLLREKLAAKEQA